MINLNRSETRQMKALHAALDAAAPDKESWTRGLKAFNEARASHLTLEGALIKALDAAAPTQELWIVGQEAFNQTNERTWRIFSESAFSTKQKAARQPRSEGK